jgi:hypothetical protein
MRETLAFTQARLRATDVVILGLDNTEAPGGHWVLAVGTEQTVVGTSTTASAILCLDPAVARPSLAPYNALIDLASPNRSARFRHYVRQDGDLQYVNCKTAIGLSLRR